MAESNRGMSKEKYDGNSVLTREVDSAAQFAVQFSGALHPEEALRIRFVEIHSPVMQLF